MEQLRVPERPRTLHVGTEADGFRVTNTPGSRDLRLECWGYWDEETSQAFLKHATAALEKAATPIVLLLDAGVLKPQATEGQEALRSFFQLAAGVPRASVSVLATNVLTRMQLTRLARDAGLELGFSDQPTSVPPMRGR